MNILKIAFLGSALVVSGAAVASYAAPEGNGNFSTLPTLPQKATAISAALPMRPPKATAISALHPTRPPKATAISARRNEERSQGSRPGRAVPDLVRSTLEKQENDHENGSEDALHPDDYCHPNRLWHGSNGIVGTQPITGAHSRSITWSAVWLRPL